jgi:hypothetical protein
MITIMVIRFQIIVFDKKSGKMKSLPICLTVIFLIVSSGCSHKSVKNDIKVMTLNVRYDNPEDSIYSWPKRASQVCDFNMPPTSTGYSILTGPNESVPLLKDSYVITEKRPSGPVYTFNGFSYTVLPPDL